MSMSKSSACASKASGVQACGFGSGQSIGRVPQIELLQEAKAAGLTTVDGATDRGLCTVSVDSLLALIQQGARTELPLPPALTRTVLSAKYSGKTEDACVRMNATFEVQVFQQGWVQLSLLPLGMAVVSSEVQETSGEEAAGALADIAVVDGHHCFLTKSAGIFVVKVQFLCPYGNKAKSCIQISDLPASARTELQFTVANRDDLQITVFNALSSNMSSSAEGSTVTSTLSPTTNLNVRWTEQQKEEEVVQTFVKLPLSITVEHQHSFGVSEGIFLADSVFNYDIRNGAVSVIEIEVDARLKILSVDGLHVKRWELQLPPSSAEIEQAPTRRILKVFLQQEVDARYTLTVGSEMTLPSAASCEFECPVFNHPHAAISREKGYISLEARTNVELEQTGSCVGCVAVDVEELPREMRQRATNPIVMAYKYLLKRFSLQLAVKKHGDVDVLIAVIDAAHFIATQTAEGRIMQQMVMKVRNTQKQYVRIDIPADCDIWSTIVSGQAVKPARDEQTGSVMVPLRKSGGKGSDKQASFTVELVWVAGASADPAKNHPMGDRGTLNFAVPKVDLPLNAVYVSVYVPEGYTYDEFEGDIKSTRSFSATPPNPSKLNDPALAARAPPMPMMSQMPAQQMYVQQAQVPMPPSSNLARHESISSLNNSDEEKEQTRNSYFSNANTNYNAPRAKPKRYAGGTAGVVPVHVEMVTMGNVNRFERLLVQQQQLNLHVTYVKEGSSCSIL